MTGLCRWSRTLTGGDAVTEDRTRLDLVRRAAGAVAVVALLVGAVACYRVAAGFPDRPAPVALPDSAPGAPSDPSGSTGAAGEPTFGRSTTGTPGAGQASAGQASTGQASTGQASTGQASTGQRTTASPGRGASSPGPSSQPTPGRPSTFTPTAHQPTPGRGQPYGPGTTETGIYLAARLSASGAFAVSETILLDQPITVVILRPPPIRLAGTDFAPRRPIAKNVSLTTGSHSVVLPTSDVSEATRVALPRPTRRLELRYQLTGVTVRSNPSAAGRALAALGPVSAGYPAQLPVAMRVTGGHVRNLQCPRLPPSDQSCAAGEPGRLRLARPLPWHEAIIVIQLDLPRPR